ncbi:hypothetical protein SCFA_2370005 [anaerobic digester metagenome]|uniref:Uncharacterized protein n=1 Tax=anaerobic digester metagenome TaxID=1263854 RepID=A0A485M0D8_9ZZZZ
MQASIQIGRHVFYKDVPLLLKLDWIYLNPVTILLFLHIMN